MLLDYGLGFSIVGILLLVAKLIRVYTPVLYKLYIPTCIIAWFLALLLGPEVLWKIIWGWSTGLFSSEVLEAWSTLPVMLINVVFWGLFLWRKIPKIQKIWNIAWPQLTFAQVVSRGQYVFWIGLAIIILWPFFGLPAMSWALIEVAFEGWHGTAAGLTTAFNELWFEEWLDLAIWLATVWVFAWIIVGVVLINRWIRKWHSKILTAERKMTRMDLQWLVADKLKRVIWYGTTRSESIEPLTVHLAFIGLSVLLWYLIREWLVWSEWLIFWWSFELMKFIPIFPLAMIGWVIVQLFLTRFVDYPIIDRKLMNSICGTAMDVLIVTALAGLSLSVLWTYFIPFLLLAVVGIARNVFAFVYLAPRMMRTYRFEKGISDFWQATWMTVIWLLLIKMTDADNKWPWLTSFWYKQLLFEPFLWWWLITAASIPLIAQFGPIPFLIIAAILMIFFYIFGYYKFWLWQSKV